MFGKLGMVVAGIAAAGLMATGTPATAATPVDDVSADRAAVTMRDLARQAGVANVWDLVSVKVAKSAPSAGKGRAAQASPYTVWVDNQTTEFFQVQLYWEEKNVTGVFGGAAAPLNPDAMSSYQIAGSNGCNVLKAYLLQIFLQGELVAQTPVTSPSNEDGYMCGDSWVMAYE